jgi:hypothetical protein
MLRLRLGKGEEADRKVAKIDRRLLSRTVSPPRHRERTGVRGARASTKVGMSMRQNIVAKNCNRKKMGITGHYTMFSAKKKAYIYITAF